LHKKSIKKVDEAHIAINQLRKIVHKLMDTLLGKRHRGSQQMKKMTKPTLKN
jgi:hypothetical protein